MLSVLIDLSTLRTRTRYCVDYINILSRKTVDAVFAAMTGIRNGPKTVTTMLCRPELNRKWWGFNNTQSKVCATSSLRFRDSRAYRRSFGTCVAWRAKISSAHKTASQLRRPTLHHASAAKHNEKCSRIFDDMRLIEIIIRPESSCEFSQMPWICFNMLLETSGARNTLAYRRASAQRRSCVHLCATGTECEIHSHTTCDSRVTSKSRV